MVKMAAYEIPDEIRLIDRGDNNTRYQTLKDLISGIRIYENTYIQLFSAMIHLEEASNSGYVQKFDLIKVQMLLHSREDSVFTVQCDIRNMPNFVKAVKNLTLNGCTVRDDRELIISSGRVLKCDNGGLVYIKIDVGIEDLLNCYALMRQIMHVTIHIFNSI